MDDDIVKRLLGYAAHSRRTPDPYRLAMDAAEEIARLRAVVNALSHCTET